MKVTCRWPRPKPDTKRCAKCQKDKPFTRDHFGPKKTTPWGLSDGWCRRCITARTTAINRETRVQALLHYSGGTPACACCGDCRMEFMTLDHIHGGGNQHRLAVTGSKKGNIYFWLKKNGYPPGFQVLCYNCNMGRAAYGGQCPYATSHPRQLTTARRSA